MSETSDVSKLANYDPVGHSSRAKMEIVCVMDTTHHRKKALEEVQKACSLVHSDLQHVQVS